MSESGWGVANEILQWLLGLSGWAAFGFQLHRWKKTIPKVVVDGKSRYYQKNKLHVAVDIINEGLLPTSIKQIEFFFRGKKLKPTREKNKTLHRALNSHESINYSDELFYINIPTEGDSVLCVIHHSFSKKPVHKTLQIKIDLPS